MTSLPADAPNQYPDALSSVVERIARIAQPERIILFGSAARGQTHDSSDLDLLVIKAGAFDRQALLKALHEGMYGVGVTVDVVLVTPEEVEKYRNTHCLIIKPALRDRREVYCADTHQVSS